MIIVVEVGQTPRFIDARDLDVAEVLRIVRAYPLTRVIGTMERLEAPFVPKSIAAAFRFEDVYQPSRGITGLEPFMGASKEFRTALVNAWSEEVKNKPNVWPTIVKTLLVGRQTRFDIDLDI